MSEALPDVNVLLAAAWPNHQFHAAAVGWFAKNRTAGWWTCAITELGVIRLSCNAAFTAQPRSPAEAAGLVAAYRADPHHHYLAQLESPGDMLSTGKLMGHRQVTDGYLAALATHHKLRFVTFDARMHGLAPSGSIEVIVPK